MSRCIWVRNASKHRTHHGALRCNHGHTFHRLAHNTFLVAHGPHTRYVKLRVAHASWMPGTFSPPPRVGNTDVHHDTCVTHVPWCMPGSLASGFLWSRWRGKRSKHSGACATRNFAYLVRCPLQIERDAVISHEISTFKIISADQWQRIWYT